MVANTPEKAQNFEAPKAEVKPEAPKPEASAPIRKKRGPYKPRDKSKATTKKAKDEAKGPDTGETIMALHGFVADATGREDLRIDDAQGAMLGAALDGVSAHTNIQVSGKATAAITLGVVLAVVYGPMLGRAIKARRAKKRAVPQPPAEEVNASASSVVDAAGPGAFSESADVPLGPSPIGI